MNQEIADNSRACCNCANATMSYPNCSCWQHKHCNGDRPYVILKEAWIKTAEECEEFELGTPEEADVYLELHRIMSEERKDKNPKPMKYIDAGKLIAEIEKRRDSALERQKNLEKIGQVTVLNEMIAFELNKILSFITSLQQEQPEVTSIKGYLNRDIGGQLVISLSPNYMDNEWMLLESKLFPNIKSGDIPRCVNITIKEV